MLRGNAERMRLRSWMQDGGIASHSARWYLHEIFGFRDQGLIVEGCGQGPNVEFRVDAFGVRV